MEVSLAVRRGSSIGSRLVSAPQVSRPPTIADSSGRSISAPGPNVVMTWLRLNWPCARPVTVRSPLSRLERSCRNRFTCGSTSRNERLTRNFL